MTESIVYALLPRGGLGNKLIVWARAFVFANKHGLKLYVSGWSEFKIGPYLRGERVKRNYSGYFQELNKPNFLQRFSFLYLHPTVLDPDLDGYNLDSTPKVYLFKTLPSHEDYFIGLRGHERSIRNAFETMLGSSCLVALKAAKTPAIAVHVRRGDFRAPTPDQTLGASCNLRIPISYYVDTINLLRSCIGKQLPVTVFTDGYAHEVNEILDLPSASIAQDNMDLVDLILLSRAKFIITSLGSTFSYWASFLSDAHVINHPAHRGLIRIKTIENNFFEGTLSNNQPLDNRQINKLKNIIEI